MRRCRGCPRPRTVRRPTCRRRHRCADRRTAAPRGRRARPRCRTGRAATAAGRGRPGPCRGPSRSMRWSTVAVVASSSANRVALTVGRQAAAATARRRSSAHARPVGPREGRRVGPRNGVRAGCDSQLSGTGAGGTTGVEQRRVGGVRGDRSGPREAVQRDDEVVDGAGARHVQQAAPLGVAHLLVERLEVLVDLVAMLVRDRPGVAVPHDGVRVGRRAVWWSDPRRR